MNRGMPSMTALFSMLAIAGYQNRDKLADMFRDATSGQPAGAKNSLSSMLGKSWRSRGRRWSRFAPERRPRRVARALQAEWARGRGPILDQSGAEPGSHPARTPAGYRSRRPSKLEQDRPVAAGDTRPLIARASYSRGPIHARRTSAGSIGVIPS